jgi:large subunit ribosomal protein L18
MNKQKESNVKRARRKKRIRKKLVGTADQPRLTAYRSLRQMYAQIIDDDTGMTLIAVSSSKLGDKSKNHGNVEMAKQVGRELGKKALEVGIRQVCFDRNGYKYHGRIRAMAEAAREVGLVF